MRGVEDALDDRVVAVVEGVAGHGVHQADVGAAGDIALAEHDAAQGVLADLSDRCQRNMPCELRFHVPYMLVTWDHRLCGTQVTRRGPGEHGL